MAYRVKAYTLREESTDGGTRYFISFKDGQGKSTSWKCRNSSLWSFGRWNAGTGISSMGRAAQGVFGSMGRNAEQAGVEAA